MDDQIQHPVIPEQQLSPQPTTPVTTTPETVAPNQGDKPKVVISDKEAQALLTINNIQSVQSKHKRGPSYGLLISLAVLVVIVVVASYALNTVKSNGSSGAGSSQSDTNATSSTTNQVNQDVNTCTNALKAMAEC